MVIKDTQGLYEIKVDTKRRIVHENYFNGLFTVDAVERLAKDYKAKVLPLLKGKEWAKFCDMRNYKMANNVEESNAFVSECVANGMTHAVLVVESVVLKMQMNRVGKNAGFAPVAFTDMKEAEDYLKSKGF